MKTKQFPLVSIVTPTFNQAKFLGQTIDSVLSQDYPNLEYIVLDDGSTDSTPELLRQYEGRLRWERHQNMGQARTLNKGWAMSKGEFLGYLSSDDRLHQGAVASLVKSLQASTNSVVAYGNYDLIDTHGRVFREVAAEDFSRGRLTEDLVCQPGPGALFRRSIIDRSGGWDEDLHQIPDFEFWLRASALGEFVHVRENVAQYRIHDDSASFRPISRARATEIVRTMQKYWGTDSTYAAQRSIAMAHIVAARSHGRSGRYLESCGEFYRGVLSCPKMFFSGFAWRLWITGLVRRLYFRSSSWKE